MLVIKHLPTSDHFIYDPFYIFSCFNIFNMHSFLIYTANIACFQLLYKFVFKMLLKHLDLLFSTAIFGCYQLHWRA
jgi:hypothetical protein